MLNYGDVLQGSYGMEYVVYKVNKATCDLVSLQDVQKGWTLNPSRESIKRASGYKLIGHVQINEKPQPEIQPYKPGDILVNSWGYDQTNVDFYQVIRSTDKTATVREINKTKTAGDMRGTCSPIPNSFKGEAMTRSIKMINGYQKVNAEYGMMELWNGKAQEYTCYA